MFTVIATAVGLLVAATPLGEALEDGLAVPALFALRGAVSPPTGVVVVTIDRTSAEALGFSSSPRDWSRTVHARVIKKLVDRGAAVIAFDMLFATPRDAEEDEEFARAVASAGNVVLLRGLERRRMTEGSAPAAVEIDMPIEPLPRLAAAAAALAPFPLPKVPSRIDRFWAFQSGSGAPTLPTVALQVSARDLTARWLELLRTEPRLQNFTAEDWNGANVTEAMRQLRQAVRGDLALADRLRTHLAASAWSELEKRRLSALLALYTGDDSRRINFRGPPGTIRTVRYSTLLGGSPGSGLIDFSAMAVFVGASEFGGVSQPDAYDTVFSRADGINISGVEIAATAYSDLADERSLHRPALAGVLVFLLTALTLGAAAAFRRRLFLLVVGITIIAAVVLAGHYAFVVDDAILPVAVPILIALPAGLLAATGSMRLEDQRARRRIDRAVRQYLPDRIARSLESGPLHEGMRPEGETIHGVCLATDAECFTTLSERLPVQRVADLLDDYFACLFAIVKSRGGIVTDVNADGTMCVWTTSGDQAKTCAAAAAAALDILAAVARFNRSHPCEELPTRIGLHAGPVRLGAIGGAGRYTSTVVGDVANTASRLEALSKHLKTRCLASEDALRDVPGLVVRPLGLFILAGKTRPIRVFEILGRQGEDEHVRGLATGFAAALSDCAARRWDGAVTRLETLRLEYPDDGPTAYFLERMRRLRNIPPAFGEEIMVRMDMK